MAEWTVDKLRKLDGQMTIHVNHGGGRHTYGYSFPDCPRLSYGYTSKRGKVESRTFIVDKTEVPDLEAAVELLNAAVTEAPADG